MYRTTSAGVYQTPELLAQIGVEGLQERLIEVGDGLPLPKAGEKRVPVDAVEGGCCPVEHLDQAQRPQAGRGWTAAGTAPCSTGTRRYQTAVRQSNCAGLYPPARQRSVLGGGVCARPQHPGGEHTVEQGLHQRQTGRTAPPRSPSNRTPEPLFKRRTHHAASAGAPNRPPQRPRLVRVRLCA